MSTAHQKEEKQSRSQNDTSATVTTERTIVQCKRNSPSTTKYTYLYFFILLPFLLVSYSSSFVVTTPPTCNKNTNKILISSTTTTPNSNQYYPKIQRKISSLLLSGSSSNEVANEVDLEKLKADLSEYMRVREETLNSGTYIRKPQKGKVVGGSRGNVILDWVSASPNKATVVEEDNNVFDYEELMEFGYTRLVSPIMDAGGRKEIYKLMNMTRPSLPERLKPKKVRKVTIDRTGETDQARYKGLKMTQILDDDEMGRALESANLKKKKGMTNLRPKIQEQMYEIPFSDGRNVGPKWVPNWTPEMLDEEGKKRGKAMAWAQSAKEGQYATDPFEDLLIENELRTYAICASLLTSIAFGKSTSTFLTSIIGVEGITNVQSVLEVSQYAALVVVLASFGSCGANWFIARKKKRSGVVWAIKGFMGGPLSIIQLRTLDDLEILVQD